MPRIRLALVAVPLLLFVPGSHAADEPAPAKVGEVPGDLRESLKLDPFYQKYANAGGLPVLSSDKDVRKHLTEAELKANFDLDFHFAHVDTIFRRVFGRA